MSIVNITFLIVFGLLSCMFGVLALFSNGQVPLHLSILLIVVGVVDLFGSYLFYSEKKEFEGAEY